ncbi:MAG: Ig-like domain-containing protein [Acidobacteria bacterium]|nr:Ig-like domain-containing protein [Acidobacteriota bacterium]
MKLAARSAALAAALLWAAAAPAADAPFAVGVPLAGRAVFGCSGVTLADASVGSDGVATWTAKQGLGHVGSNGDVVLSGRTTVQGDAIPGPGRRTVVPPESKVTGLTTPARDAADCRPVDLAVFDAFRAKNDNARIPKTAAGRDAVKDGALVLDGPDPLTLPAGTYVFSSIALSNRAHVLFSGEAHVFVTGDVSLTGNSHMNPAGGGFRLRLVAGGARVSLDTLSTLGAFVYAPGATATFATGSRLVGSVFADSVVVREASVAIRAVDDTPPVVDLAEPVEDAAVSLSAVRVRGSARDPETAVTALVVNGVATPVAADGSFDVTVDATRTLEVRADVTNAAGLTASLRRSLCTGAPSVAIRIPANGSVVASRTGPVAGTCGSASTVTVNGVPAAVSGGTFQADGVDFGPDGVATVTVVASNACASSTAVSAFVVDSAAPSLAIDSPAPGSVFGASPISVTGTFVEANLVDVTVNGVVAAISGNRFTATVSLPPGSSTLVAVARDVAGRSGRSAEISVSLDAGSPNVRITSPASGVLTGTATTTVSGVADVPGLAGVKVAGIAATLTGTSFTAVGVPLAEGDNRVVAEAVDASARTFSSAAVVVTLDTLPPAVVLETAGLPALTSLTSLAVSGTVSDPHLAGVTVNGVAAVVSGGRFTATAVPLVEGDNALRARASDTLSHVADSNTATVNRDTQAPTVAITSPAPNALLAASGVTVTGTASDPHLAGVTVNGVAAAVASGQFTATLTLAEGDTALVARAADAAGNAGASAAVGVTVDTLAPVVSIDAPADPLTGSAFVTVTGTVVEPHLLSVTVSGVPASVSGGKWVATNVPLVEGTQQIKAVAVDTFGHRGESAAVEYRLDSTPPVLTMDAPAAASAACRAPGVPVAVSGRVYGRGAARPVVTLTVQTAGAAVQTFTATLDAAGTTWTVPAVDLGSADGIATLTASTTDALGHDVRVLRSFRIKASTPSLALLLDGGTMPGAGPGAAASPGETPVLFGRALSPRVAVSDGPGSAPPAPVVTLDGAPWAGAPISAEGTHLLSATATDCAGHSVSAHALFTIDVTPPRLLTFVPADGASLGAPVASVSGTSDPDLASATVNGAAAATSGGAFSLSPFSSKEGANTASIVLVDKAGNRATFSRSFSVKSLAPSVEILESGAPLGAGARFFRSVAPVVRSNDPSATVLATLNGVSFLSGTSISVSGDYTLSATATDALGHSSSANASFKVDLTPGPAVDITAPADRAVLPGPTVAVTGTASASVTSVTVNGRAATLTGATWSLPDLVLPSDVPSEIVAIAADSASRTASATRQVTVRASGPQITILEPSSGARTNRKKIDVAGAVVGGPSATANGTVTVAGQTLALDALGTFRAKDVPLQTGANTLTASATDALGRTGTASVTVTTDTTAPGISLAADGQPLAEGASFARPFTLRVAISDDAAPLPIPTIRLNGADKGATAAVTDLAIAQAGGYVLSVVARDAAGNESRADRSFVLASGGCAVSALDPGDGAIVAAPKVTLKGRSGDAASVTVTSGGQTFATQLADGTFAAGDVPLAAVGENTLAIACTDRAGAVSTTNLKITRLQDGAGPVVRIVQPAGGARQAGATVAVTGTVSDPGASVTVNGVKAPVASGAFSAGPLPLVEGPNVLAARAVDAAGRGGEDRVVVFRDSAAPKIAITSPPDGAHVGKPGAGAAVLNVSGVVDLTSEPNLASVVVATGAGSVTATVDPDTGSFFAGGVPLVTASPGAPQNVTATATDTLAQAGTATVKVIYDPAAPALVLGPPVDGARFSEASPPSFTASGEAWAKDGAIVSINGGGLDGLAWDAAAADGRRHATFSAQVTVPSAEGPFGVIARVEEPSGAFANDKRLLFKDTTAPTVVDMQPADAAKQVDANEIPLVLFSEAIRPSSLSAADGLTLTRVATGDRAVGTFTVAGSAVAFAPGAAMVRGEAYKFRAGTGITDLAGHPLAAAREVRFTVAAVGTGAAPVLDALPPVVCATQVVVSGTAAPNAAVRVRDASLSFTGNADAGGRFAVTIPLSGNGWHAVHAAVIDSGGSPGPEAAALFRVDCSAPSVAGAAFDRGTGKLTVAFTEAMKLTSLTVGGAGSAVTASKADDATNAPQAAALSLSTDGLTATLDLGSGPAAWWAGLSVRLSVGPPASDASGNAMAAPYATVFFVGGGGDPSGGFLSGAVLDEESGRPLSSADVKLYASGAVLPGAALPAQVTAPVASTVTDGRGRFSLTGDIPAGRYALVLSRTGYTRSVRRLALEPAVGAVPFGSRLTPLAAQAPSLLVPGSGGSFAGPAGSNATVDFAANALASATNLGVRLTPLAGQGLPEPLPLGFTPLAAAELRLIPNGAGDDALPEGAGTPFAAGAVTLTLPLPAGINPSDLFAARYDVVAGAWLALPLPVFVAGSGANPDRARHARGPRLRRDHRAGREPRDAAAGPARQPRRAARGRDLPSTVPTLTATIALDPLIVSPTGRATARVVARSSDGTTPWPSGLAVQGYLDEKLILSAAGRAPARGAVHSRPRPLPSAALRGRSRRHGLRRGGRAHVPRVTQPARRAGPPRHGLRERPPLPVHGPARARAGARPGGRLGDDGGRRRARRARERPRAEDLRLRAEAHRLRAGAPAACRGLHDRRGRARQPLGCDARARGHAEAERAFGPPRRRGRRPALRPRRLCRRARRRPRCVRERRLARHAPPAAGAVPAKLVAAPEASGSPLPFPGVAGEGVFLYLHANAPVGFVTGRVTSPNGAGIAGSRVTAAGLGTANLSVPGGVYAVPAPAGAPTLNALHPTLGVSGSGQVPSLVKGQVATLDLVLTPVPPTIRALQPLNGATDQPVGSTVSIAFSAALDPASVTAATLSVSLADATGAPTGLVFNGTTVLSPDRTTVVFTPARPLPPGKRIAARFTGGVRDAAGTLYGGALPVDWSFGTSTQFVTGGAIHPEKIRLLVPVNGVAQILGADGALPLVTGGTPPWSVWADVEGPVCPSKVTQPANANGGFTVNAGCPPTVSVTISSKVWLHVIDPTGAEAATFKLGPFATPDGKGFVANPGEDAVFTTSEGVEVTAPAGAFDVPTLVKVTKQPLDSLNVALNPGLEMGAVLNVDFDGTAKETLRLRIPVTTASPVGGLVFAGTPIDLPWGRKLKILDVGRLVDDGKGGKLISTLEADQPEDPALTAGATPGSSAAAGRTALISRKLLRTIAAEMTARGSVAFVFGTTLPLMGVTGAVVSGTLFILYNAIADSFVFQALANDWSGRYVLPAYPGQALSVIKRDVATGWILARQDYASPAGSGGLTNLGTLDAGPDTPPILVDASPIRVLRFTAPPVDATRGIDTLRLALEMEARVGSDRTASLAGVPGFAFADGTSVDFLDFTQAAAKTPSGTVSARVFVSGGAFATGPIAARPADDMFVYVSPGELDPAGVSELTLTFSRRIDNPTGNAADLVALWDCGDVARVLSGSAPSCPGASVKVAATADLALAGAQIVVHLPGRLAEGRQYRLDLVGVKSAPKGIAYPLGAPSSFFFATRRTGDPFGKIVTSALGDTNSARDLLKFGNLLLVGSATGRLVAVDVSDPKNPATWASLVNVDATGAATNAKADALRAFATDGHGRLFYNVQFGSSWAVRTVRIEDVRERKAPAPTTPLFTDPGYFTSVDGGVRTAFAAGAIGTLLGGDYLALVGSLPAGTPSSMEVVVRDDAEPSAGSYELRELYERPEQLNAPDSFKGLPSDHGFYEFDVRVYTMGYGSTPADHRANRASVCGEQPWDRYQRVSVDNLSTGQTWSADVENPWPPGGTGDGTRRIRIRGRLGDRLRIRYNVVALGYLSIVGSGISVLDLNRMYRNPGPVAAQANKSQCNRRVGKYEGEDVALYGVCPAPNSAGTAQGVPTLNGLSNTPALVALPGPVNVNVYSVLTHFGVVHESAKLTTPGDLSIPSKVPLQFWQTPDGATCLGERAPAGLRPAYRAIAYARDAAWTDLGIRVGTGAAFNGPALKPVKTTGDLLFVSMGVAGILSISLGPLANGDPIGRYWVEGHSVYRLQADVARGLLFAGGQDRNGNSIVDVWDLARANGGPTPAGVFPPASGQAVDPRLLATLYVPWDTNHIGLDETGAGLVYTWGYRKAPDGSGGVVTEEGAFVMPFDAPSITFAGVFRKDTAAPAPGTLAPSVRQLVTKLDPLGVPLRLSPFDERDTPADETCSDLDRALGANCRTAAFKVRVALPGSAAGRALGATLNAKVQSLRGLPDKRLLAQEDLGALVPPCGGTEPCDGGAHAAESGWPDRDVWVTLRRIGKGYSGADITSPDGPTSNPYDLYESDETVVLVADPRARFAYWKPYQALEVKSGNPPDERHQCRRCDRPPTLPQDASDTSVVELLAGGPYVRAFLSPKPGSPDELATRAAILYFNGTNYPPPSGYVRVSGFADEVPSVTQIALAEPAQNPAVWTAEAGASVRLTSGEGVVETRDFSAAARSLGFALDRTYRSGVAGYGPLGAAGWNASLFAHLRETALIPPVPGGSSSYVDYHDGAGQVWRFVDPGKPVDSSTTPPSDFCPAGTARDGGETYCTPKGLYMRLDKVTDGTFRLVGRNNDTLRFDPAGRLTMISDRHAQEEPDKKGSSVRLYYTPAGDLVRVQDEMGRVYRLTYFDSADPANAGLLKKIEDFSSPARTVTFEYDRRRLSKVTLPKVTKIPPELGIVPGDPVIRYGYGASTNANTAPPLHGPLWGGKLETFTLPGETSERIRFTYDLASGRASPVLAGKATTVTWKLTATPATAEPAKSVEVLDPSGLRTTYTLDDKGHVANVLRKGVEVSKGGAPALADLSESYLYRDDGRISFATRADGTKMDYAPPPAGPQRLAYRIPSVTEIGKDPDGSITRGFEYQGDGLVEKITDPEGRTITPGVPAAGLKVDSKTSDGLKSSTTFDDFGRPKTYEGGAGTKGETTYLDDALGVKGGGFPLEVVKGDKPSGKYAGATFERDERGNPTEIRESSGAVTKIDYDEWDRPVHEDFGRGGEQEAPGEVFRGFDTAGRLKKEIRTQLNAGNVTTTWEYNDRDQVTEIKRDHVASATPFAAPDATSTTKFTYDVTSGFLKSVSTDQGTTTTYRFESAGRLAEVTPDGSGARQFGYDEMGRPTYVFDGDKGTWNGSYDSFGRLAGETLPTGGIVTRTFDNAGGLKTAKLADGLGAVLSEIPSAEVTSWGALKNLERRVTAGTSLLMTRELDAEGRLTLQKSDDRKDLEMRFEDGTDRPAFVGDAVNGLTLGYGSAATAWPKSLTYGVAVDPSKAAVPTVISTLKHDTLGRVVEDLRDDGTLRTARFDEEGRPVETTDGASATQLRWDSRGALVQLIRPAGQGATGLGYDHDGRLTAKKTDAGGASFQSTYDYYAPGGSYAGLLRTFARTDGPTLTVKEYYPDDMAKTVSLSDGSTAKFEYDDANRLTKTTVNGGSSVPGGALYAWDAASRMRGASRLMPNGIDVDPSAAVVPGAYDFAGRPHSETVGSRPALTRDYDLLGGVTSLGLPLGVGAARPFGYTRAFEPVTHRLASVTGTGDAPPPGGVAPSLLGASWAWVGDDRVLGVTSNGPLHAAHRFGYVGGPGGPDGSVPGAAKWKLGTLTVGTDPGAKNLLPFGDPLAPGSAPWGQFAYGYNSSITGDGTKLGRRVTGVGLAGLLAGSLLSNLGYAYGLDASKRLTTAYAGPGSVTGADAAAAIAAFERFKYEYGSADQLQKENPRGRWPQRRLRNRRRRPARLAPARRGTQVLLPLRRAQAPHGRRPIHLHLALRRQDRNGRRHGLLAHRARRIAGSRLRGGLHAAGPGRPQARLLVRRPLAPPHAHPPRSSPVRRDRRQQAPLHRNPRVPLRRQHPPRGSRQGPGRRHPLEKDLRPRRRPPRPRPGQGRDLRRRPEPRHRPPLRLHKRRAGHRPRAGGRSQRPDAPVHPHPLPLHPVRQRARRDRAGASEGELRVRDHERQGRECCDEDADGDGDAARRRPAELRDRRRCGDVRRDSLRKKRNEWHVDDTRRRGCRAGQGPRCGEQRRRRSAAEWVCVRDELPNPDDGSSEGRSWQNAG